MKHQIATLKTGVAYPFIGRVGGWSTLNGPSGQFKVRNSDIAKLEEAIEAELATTTEAKPAERPAGRREKLPLDQRRNGIVPSSYLGIYQKSKLSTGATVLDCGDVVANQLRGLELAEIYEVVADKLDCSVASLQRKYEHLNNGQQRMNLGNRLRGFYRSLDQDAK